MPRSPRKKTARAATLADVGKAAGVSAMAASAVLNGARTSSRISPDTRTRIMEAAAQLRYRPNVAARALANRRMNTIGVAAVIEGGELNYYFLEAFNGILEAAMRHGQTTTVFTLHDWNQDAARITEFCDGRIDGLILIGPTLTKEAAEALPDHTPFVALHPNEQAHSIISVESDEEHGAYDMVRYLASLGHRRIMHLSGRKGLLGAERRIEGYLRALRDCGLPFYQELLVEAHFSIPHGRLALESWLSKHSQTEWPDAIFCASDSIAVGALESLSARGIRVPEDISVCGFDDSLAARSTVPQLASVRQPLRNMGSKAVDILLDRIRGQQAHSQTDHELAPPVVFKTELVIRGSIGSPARGQKQS